MNNYIRDNHVICMLSTHNPTLPIFFSKLKGVFLILAPLGASNPAGPYPNPFPNPSGET